MKTNNKINIQQEYNNELFYNGYKLDIRFKSIIRPSRTESIDSDLIIDRNGRRKTKLM